MRPIDADRLKVVLEKNFGHTGGASVLEQLIDEQPTIQPVATDTNVGDKISKFIDGLEETLAYIREREGGDSVCGLCEYDGAYIGESGDWCNECLGFDRDDCFKLSDDTRKKWTDEILTICKHFGNDSEIPNRSDCISRQAAIDAAKHAWAKGLEPSQYIEIIPPAQPEAKEDWLYDYLVGRLGKSIVDNKEEFHKWFERMVWHVKRCDELSEERRSRQWISCEEIQPEERTKSHAETHACDSISRQATIDAYGDWYVEEGTADGFIGTVKQLLEGLPPAQPEQKWIPCSERLPEDYKDVLITYTYSFELTCPQDTAKLLKGVKTVSGNPIDPKVVWEVPFADYIAFYDVDEKRWFSPTDNPEPFPDEIKVIAWMPLPEPYEGGTE